MNNSKQPAPVPQPQQAKYQPPQQQLNQLRHIQYETTPPQYQQQFVPDPPHLIYDFQQPRLATYRTVFPAVPTIQIPQPVFGQQVPQPQNQQPQYVQPQYQQPLNQNRQIEPPPQPQVSKYQGTPVNNLIQARDIERPIFFKPGSTHAVYPPVQYFGKFAQSIFGNRNQ